MTPDAALGRRRPLYFLHIPKTGGVSLTDALARLFPPEQVFVGAGGNLTLADLDYLGARLEGPLFLSGHPDAGVTRALTGRADIITLLRNPRDQVVSNYLHVLADPQNPYHAAANRQSFPDFLRENPTLAAFQTFALAFALSDDRRSGLDSIAAFLDALPFVGVIERPETCAAVLEQLTGANRPLHLPCLNAAVYRGVSSARLRALQRSYDALRDDPRLSELLAREHEIYAHAARRLEALAAGLSRRAAAGPPGFIAPSRFRDRQGPLRGETTRHALTGVPGHVIFGPYARLPRGHHVAQFDLAVSGARSGRVEIEVLANDRLCLGRRWLPAAAVWAPRQLALAFANPDPANVLEFRVKADRCEAGELTFRGVTVRPTRLARTWPSLVARGLRGLRPRRLRISGRDGSPSPAPR